MLLTALPYSARPRVWIQPQDYTASQFAQPQSQMSSVVLHRSLKSARKNSIRSKRERERETERSGKEIKDATRTPELRIPFHVRSLYYSDSHFVLSASWIRLFAFRSFAVFTGSQRGRIQAEIRAGWGGRLHATISNLFICNLKSGCAAACCELTEPRSKRFRIVSLYTLGICANGLSKKSDSLSYETLAPIGIRREAHSSVTFDKRCEGITT
jgi:hypothetical protein